VGHIAARVPWSTPKAGGFKHEYLTPGVVWERRTPASGGRVIAVLGGTWVGHSDPHRAGVAEGSTPIIGRTGHFSDDATPVPGGAGQSRFGRVGWASTGLPALKTGAYPRSWPSSPPGLFLTLRHDGAGTEIKPLWGSSGGTASFVALDAHMEMENEGRAPTTVDVLHEGWVWAETRGKTGSPGPLSEPPPVRRPGRARTAAVYGAMEHQRGVPPAKNVTGGPRREKTWVW